MKSSQLAKPYYRSFFEHNRLRFGAAMLLNLLDVPFSLMVAWILGEVMDAAAAGDPGRLGRLLGLAVAAMGVYAVVLLLQYRVRGAFARRALEQYKALAFRKITEKSISAFSREDTGRYLSVLTNDVTVIEEKYLLALFDLAGQVCLMPAALVMMMGYSPTLTVFAVAVSLLPLILSVAGGGPLAKREEELSDRNEGFVSMVKDLLGGFSVLKSFKAEEEGRDRFDSSSRDVETARFRRHWYSGVVNSLAFLGSSVLQFGVFFFGAYLAIRGEITAGTVVVFVQAANYLIQPVGRVPRLWAGIKAAGALVEKTAQTAGENAQREGIAIPARLERDIRLEKVSFGYEEGKPVLNDLSMTLEAGKKYALVGGSGSGKSTLLNLLMGAYEGYEGSLTVDGKEMRDIDPDSLYDLISLIGQNVFLFDDTIRRNITLFKDFPDEAVASAEERSGLSALVAAKGEDYRCGENGRGLSGGERQRVSIARCLLRNTPVLLLDEATAALDNQTAFSVVDSILKLEGLTRLVVTHRLEKDLLEQYDEIFVLKNGSICERGSFAELMEGKGTFYSLYTLSA